MRLQRTGFRLVAVALVAAVVAASSAGVRASTPAYAAVTIDPSTTTATMTSYTAFPGTVANTYTPLATGWRREMTFNAPPGTGPIRTSMQIYYGTTTPPGTYWRADPDNGGIFLMNAATGKAAAWVHSPWAYDRLGNRLPVTLRLAGLDGDQFLLQVGLPSTRDRFPVTVDPHYAWGWVTGTIYFNRSETAQLAGGAALVAILTKFLPPPWGTIVSTYAGVLATVAGIANGSGRCVSLNSVGLAFSYSGSEGDGYCR